MDPRISSFDKSMSSPLQENNRRSTLLSPGTSRLVKTRYCVSDTGTPNSKMFNNYSPGPLLTPVNFNTSLSTYIDTKSPGLSSRIVQYNSESPTNSEPFVLNQAKYNSPGMFPIVHLQKKNLPVRKLMRDSVTVRLVAAHESPSNVVNGNGLHNDNDSSDVSTSSVLKALRAISKKRMLTEDITSPQNNHKRQRNNCQIEVAEVHVDGSSCETPTKTSDDVPCVVDALAASLTSSNAALVSSRNMLKRKICKTTLEAPSIPSPKVMLIEVQTQTDVIKVSSVTQTVEEKPKELEIPVSTVQTAVVEVPSKPNVSNLPLHSIMSPPDRPKHDRHVSFALPENSTTSEPAAVSAEAFLPPISVAITNDNDFMTTPTPMNSPVLSESLFDSEDTSIPDSNTPAPFLQTVTTEELFKNPQSDVTASFPPVTSTTPIQPSISLPLSISLPAFSAPTPLFTPIKPTTSFQMPTLNGFTAVTSTASTPFVPMASTEPVSESFAIPTTPIRTETTTVPNIFTTNISTAPIVFGATTFSEKKSPLKVKPETSFASGFLPPINPNVNEEKSTGFGSVQSKPGGFKFDLGGPSNVVTTPESLAQPSFSFSTSKPAAAFDFGANTKVTSAFGSTSIFSTGVETKSSSSVVFPLAKDTAGVSELKPAPSVLFSSAKDNSVINEPKPVFNTLPVSTPSSGMNTFDFTAKNDQTAAAFSSPFQAATTANSNMFNFGPGTSTSTPSAFGTTAPINSIQAPTDTSTFKFGTSTAAPSIFNAPTNTSNESNLFKTNTSSESNLFKFGSSGFNSPSAFKDNKPQTSEPPGFAFSASTAAPAFTSPVFNSVQPSNNESGLFKFGTNNPTAQPPNESTFKFGAQNDTGAFKFGAPTNTAGQMQNEPNLFKFAAPVTTTAASLFTTPSFNSFGSSQPEQTPYKFGGAPSTTSAAPMFNPSPFNFTASTKPEQTSFQTPTTSFNGFGSFEAKPANPFNTSSFGDNKTTPFGSSQAFGVENKPASVFGAPAPTENVFGSFNNGQPQFGTAAPTQPFQFGAPSANPPPSVFSFGATTEPPKTAAPGVFSFGGSGPASGFGSTPSVPTFGAATPNSFGMQAPAVPSFGSTIPGAAPMFSIGTGGSATNKPRTQLKARRRT